MSENRPLDVLEAAVGTAVSVRLKGGDRFGGELVGFDQHMNLVLEPLESTESSASSIEDSAPEPSEGVDNTTVIRGDNLVSIEP